MLFHYTCHHYIKIIGRHGTLMPRDQPVLGGHKLVWMTDLAIPDRNGLGLTSHLLGCDRMAFRYVVTDASCVIPWKEARFSFGPLAMFLEMSDGAMPEHWFVSHTSVPAKLDRSYTPLSVEA
jgi:hypothetical protein